MTTPIKELRESAHARNGRFTSTETLADRFWKKVDKGGPVSLLGTNCWVWMGAMNWGGYGSFGKPARSAHRVAWEMERGPIPGGLHIDHICRNRACVNPAHMEPIAPATNTHRGQGVAARNARKTHCPKGHPLSGENLAMQKHSDGGMQRRCRTCDREVRARQAARLKGTEAAREKYRRSVQKKKEQP